MIRRRCHAFNCPCLLAPIVVQKVVVASHSDAAGMASKKDEPIQLDFKTEAVLKRKGYVVKEMLNSGSFGKVSLQTSA